MLEHIESRAVLCVTAKSRRDFRFGSSAPLGAQAGHFRFSLNCRRNAVLQQTTFRPTATISGRCAISFLQTQPRRVYRRRLKAAQVTSIDALQLACICLLRILRRRVIANSAVTASSMATMMNTEVQLPVVCLRNAAAGPPKIEPTPCAI